MKQLLLSYQFASSFHAKILIAGGGTAGLNTASQLVRHHNVLPHTIRVIEPSLIHAYQPGWTMVGGGLCSLESTIGQTARLFPKDVDIIRRRIQSVNPSTNTVELDDGTSGTYEQLVIATGNTLDWSQIKGAQEALDDENVPVASIYQGQYAAKMNRLVEKFQGGTALFTEPQMPIKCAGAPQKILYLTHDRVSKKKINTTFEFHKTIGVVFGVPKYAEILKGLIDEKGINLHLKSKLVEIRGRDRIAVFENQDTKELTEKSFDLLHIVPPQNPPSFIKASGLGDAQGYVDVHRGTLQHNKYENIWSLGDSSSLPTSKTAAAIMSQTPILTYNLVSSMRKTGSPQPAYEGYTSCPIFTSQSKLLLAEFKYDGIVDETFGGRLQSGPNSWMFQLKKRFFPLAYWQFMRRGFWKGRDGFLFSGSL